MTTEDPNGVVPAILDQLAAHAEQITRQDTGLAGLSGRLDAIAGLAASLDARITALAARLTAEDDDEDRYTPASARRWWQLTGSEREQAVAVLRCWVERVYRPGYGQLAAGLGPCWEQHPLCLYAIDILAELWSLLYLREVRTAAIVSAQAEYQARIIPALAGQLSGETTGCRHPLAPSVAPRPRSVQ